VNAVSLLASGSVTVNALVYDAGTEPNDELCANIPGPVCGGEGGSPDVDGEGFVHIHAGIHDIDDLPAQDYDWRNPGARITITKLP
jgi:N-methylhydantoinase B/oxoprolinase/acetone carboxylase alpha subunit